MTTPPPDRPPRKQRPQITLSVESTQWLTPHLVRVVANGPGMADFTDNGASDKYVKIRFGDVTRTYTVRWAEAERLAIDFVVHGDEGLAGPWAANAKPGDTLTFSGPGGGYFPDPEADWHLFAGDASALPAIGAALEALPADAAGLAFLVVEDESEVIDLAAPHGVRLKWLLHAPPGSDPALLAAAIDAADWLPGRTQVFAHGERESMKAIRAVVKERGVPREDLSLSGYWAYGRNEDRFQAEKRDPIGKID
ncbi:MAG: siderophore-interacting protein [Nocardioides sp.]|nr:siderophore-interacting protein [Nocardioides sp.]